MSKRYQIDDFSTSNQKVLSGRDIKNLELVYHRKKVIEGLRNHPSSCFGIEIRKNGDIWPKLFNTIFRFEK
jgi:hypothetical protein